MEEALLLTAVMGLLHLVPLALGVRHHKRLRDRLDDAGTEAGLIKHGATPVWHTHGRGVVWEGTQDGRRVAVQLRLDPKKRIYAKIRVEQTSRVTDGLFVRAADAPSLDLIGWTELEVTRGAPGKDWRLTFVGADGLGLLSDLTRWDPSRDKGPVPTDVGDYVHARLGDWLELGYRQIDAWELGKLIRFQAQLIADLEREEERHWKELAARHELVRSLDQLSGSVRGRAIQVHYDVELEVTTVRSAVVGPPVHLAHKDHIQATRPLANPVLGMLIGAWAPEGVDLDALLQDEDRTEALLAVVHAWPGSAVKDGSVELSAPLRLRDQLPDAIDAVVRLANALESHWGQP